MAELEFQFLGPEFMIDDIVQMETLLKQHTMANAETNDDHVL